MKETFETEAKIALYARVEAGSVVLFMVLEDNYAKRIAFYLWDQDKDLLRHREFIDKVKETNGIPIGWVLTFSVYKNIELIKGTLKIRK